MDVYFSDQVNDPSLRLFSSTKRFDTDTFDDKNFDEELQAVLAAANLNSSMSTVLQNLGIGLGMTRQSFFKRDSNMTSNINNNNNNNTNNNNNNKNSNNPMDIDIIDDKHDDEDEDKESVASINLSTKLLSSSLMNTNISTNDKNNNKSHLTSLNSTSKMIESIGMEKDGSLIEPNNNTLNSNRNLMGRDANSYSTNSEGSINSSRNSASSHANINDDDYEDNMVRAYERNLKNLNQKFLHEMSEHHNIDQYLLSWRGFHGNMCKGFHNLQRDGQMVDVTIAAGGKIFKAHKLVSDAQ